MLSTAGTLSLFGQTSAGRHAAANAPQPAASSHPVTAFVYERARGIGWDWYDAPPYDNSYGYGESLLRFGLSQTLAHWDWKVEITQPTILDAPNYSVSPVTAQGQLGLGATYYVANGNNHGQSRPFSSRPTLDTTPTTTRISASGGLSGSKAWRQSRRIRRSRGFNRTAWRSG